MKIPIAEFRAKNIKENPMCTVYVESENGRYYYLTYGGSRGWRYDSLAAAREDIKNLWGSWHDFRLLDKED